MKSNESAIISVMLQPVDQVATLESERTKHKFMIQTAFANNTDIPGKDIRYFNLKSSGNILEECRSFAGDGLKITRVLFAWYWANATFIEWASNKRDQRKLSG